MQNFKEFVERYAGLLPVGTSISYTEAEKRAGLFLEAMATITDIRHSFNAEKIRALSSQTAVFAQELSKGTAKTMTENKMSAEASPSYVEARETLEGIENDLSYLKAYYDIFNNAHIFYRTMSKGENL